MAISITWATKVIFVPKADLTFISGLLYEHDTDAFRLALKALEAGETGMVFDDTHRHNTQYTLSGVVYSRALEIINGYTVEYEDGQYRVRLSGTNNNILDVAVVNQVGIAPQNSAGLQTVAIPSDLDSRSEIKQAWAVSLNPTKMRAVVSLELANQFIVLPADARLSLDVRDDAGVQLFAQADIAPNAQGYFSVEENPFTPTEGTVFVSIATIVNGTDTYKSIVHLAVPEF